MTRPIKSVISHRVMVCFVKNYSACKRDQIQKNTMKRSAAIRCEAYAGVGSIFGAGIRFQWEKTRQKNFVIASRSCLGFASGGSCGLFEPTDVNSMKTYRLCSGDGLFEREVIFYFIVIQTLAKSGSDVAIRLKNLKIRQIGIVDSTTSEAPERIWMKGG